MKDNPRILITGINGFIGNALAESIRNKGYDVWGLDIVSNHNRQVIGVNLLDRNEFAEVYKKIPQCPVLIHTAALAHGQKPPKGETVITTNLKITDNVLEFFGENTTDIIILSSVAVYGEDNRKNPVLVGDIQRPSTDYGKSKLICEDHVLKSAIKNCTILRLAPVYDKKHMMDIRKRVFFPFFPIKMRIIPTPKYSLTSIDTVISCVVRILSQRLEGKNIYNISDSKPYTQKELTTWFPGKEIVLPVFLTKPFYWLTYLFPHKYGYMLRCYYWKLFCSNVYDIDYQETL